MSTISHETITREINKLKSIADDQELEALNRLHDQLSKAGSASWTRDELESELKQDNDVLDSFDQETYFYEEVRAIQDSIIGFFD